MDPQPVVPAAPSAAESPRGLHARPVEIATALVLIVIAALVLWDSCRLGMRWADDGPQPGYFPFYVGLVLALSSAMTLWRALRSTAGGVVFVLHDQLRTIARVLLPLTAFVAAAYVTGLYLAAWVFMAYCMRAIGRYAWPASLGLPIAVVAVLFVLFELWFKVPLLKGPLEAVLGWI